MSAIQALTTRREIGTVNSKTFYLKFDGAYSGMLCTALKVSWRDHITNENLYGHLLKVSSKIRKRRMRVAGHCVRHKDEEASKLVLWQPQHRQTERELKT